MKNYSAPLEQFLDHLRIAQQDHRAAQQTLADCDAITQDLLHDLELNAHSYHELARISKRMVEVRQARRTAKDTIAITQPLLDLEKPLVKALERLLGEVRKQEKNTENRRYFNRYVASSTTTTITEDN